MAISAEKAHHRARRANALQRGDTETAELAARDLRAAMLAEHIKTAVDAAPPLTDEQRARLAGLLAPSGGDQRAA
jgi:hypothetical protein